jgi:hypothetical protein
LPKKKAHGRVKRPWVNPLGWEGRIGNTTMSG